MSYQVLARKWRPRTFEEMVGQEFVLRALVNALDNDRLHHAYLFTGTRGVGKTTLARILAKSLNCEQGVSSQPCGTCTACREIDEGRFVDLIEVDAASRTRVEETRELLENVQYAPTRGRYKVYLIDEVHMFSAHSFNALLKTLEEPPPHVKFLLATTDPQKLPVTILSRCLQFNLKRLPADLIRAHLEHILKQEAIPYETPALVHLARAADGSMRDALSLLDQGIAFTGGNLLDAEVRTMLGTLEQHYVVELLQAAAEGDAPAVVGCIGRMAERTPDFAGVLAELISMLQRIALAQAVPDAVDDSVGDREAVLNLAARISPADVQLYYQIALIGRRDLDLAPDPQGGFEMVMLRILAFRPLAEGEQPPVRGQPVRGVPEQTPASSAKVLPARGGADAPGAAVAEAGDEWVRVVDSLNLGGLERELAMNCALKSRDNGTVTLTLAPSLGNLRNPRLERRLQETLGEHYGEPVRLVIELDASPTETPAQMRARLLDERQKAAVTAIAEDGAVKSLCETFDAHVDPVSIRPVD